MGDHWRADAGRAVAGPPVARRHVLIEIDEAGAARMTGRAAAGQEARPVEVRDVVGVPLIADAVDDLIQLFALYAEPTVVAAPRGRS